MLTADGFMQKARRKHSKIDPSFQLRIGKANLGSQLQQSYF